MHAPYVTDPNHSRRRPLRLWPFVAAAGLSSSLATVGLPQPAHAFDPATAALVNALNPGDPSGKGKASPTSEFEAAAAALAREIDAVIGAQACTAAAGGSVGPESGLAGLANTMAQFMEKATGKARRPAGKMSKLKQWWSGGSQVGRADLSERARLLFARLTEWLGACCMTQGSGPACDAALVIGVKYNANLDAAAETANLTKMVAGGDDKFGDFRVVEGQRVCGGFALDLVRSHYFLGKAPLDTKSLEAAVAQLAKFAGDDKATTLLSQLMHQGVLAGVTNSLATTEMGEEGVQLSGSSPADSPSGAAAAGPGPSAPTFHVTKDVAGDGAPSYVVEATQDMPLATLIVMAGDDSGPQPLVAGSRRQLTVHIRVAKAADSSGAWGFTVEQASGVDIAFPAPPAAE